MPSKSSTKEEPKGTLAVGDPQAGYVSPDLSYHEGTGTIPDEEKEWHEKRNDQRDKEVEQVEEQEDEAVKQRREDEEKRAKEAEKQQKEQQKDAERTTGLSPSTTSSKS